MKTFMGIMLIIGVVLTIYALKIGVSVEKCNDNARKAVQGLTFLGVMILSVSATYLAFGCGCGSDDKNDGSSMVGFMLIVSITVIGLASTIKTHCSDAKKDADLLLGLSSGVTGLSALFLSYKLYNKYGGKAKEMFESARDKIQPSEPVANPSLKFRF